MGQEQGKTALLVEGPEAKAWDIRAYEMPMLPHKRLQAFAAALLDASQPNGLKPGELRKLAARTAGYLLDVAVDVAFMTPRKPD